MKSVFQPGKFKMEKNCCIVVTYFPDNEALSNLEYLSTICEELIVVDNTPEKNDLSKLKNTHNFKVYYLGENMGIGFALNFGVEIAGALGYEFIFLFDQDSKPGKNFIIEMIEFKKINKLNNTVICAPNFYDRNSKTEAKYSILNKWKIKNITCSEWKKKEPLFVSFAITSGSLLSYSLYEKLGPFREDYFIDHVDSEYCLRAVMNNYDIAVNPNCILEHSVGKRTKEKLLFLTIKPNNHIPVRRFYIARNCVRLSLEYFKEYPSNLFLNFQRIVHEILCVTFYEKNKIAKIQAIICGMIYGLLGKMGPAPLKLHQ
jgi:rhamnosyltransferase